VDVYDQTPCVRFGSVAALQLQGLWLAAIHPKPAPQINILDFSDWTAAIARGADARNAPFIRWWQAAHGQKRTFIGYKKPRTWRGFINRCGIGSGFAAKPAKKSNL